MDTGQPYDQKSSYTWTLHVVQKSQYRIPYLKNIYLSFKCILMMKAKKIIVKIQAPKFVLDLRLLQGLILLQYKHWW